MSPRSSRVLVAVSTASALLVVVGGCSLDTEGSAATGSTLDGGGGIGFGGAAAVGGTGPSDGGDAGGASGDGGAKPIPDGGCFPGTKACGGTCVPANDPAHGCSPVSCEPCALANATARCEAQQCRIEACTAPFDDCNQDPADGCERNLQLDPTHCGACGTDCIASFGTNQECAAGQCRVSSCPGTTRDCNMAPGDGCEVDTATSTSHCGFCGNACDLPHASETCIAGQCEILSCNGDWADCDGNAGTGCEVDTDVDEDHCGACRNACDSTGGTRRCTNGACAITCSPGRGDCDGNAGNGCETNTTTNTSHCGGCGQRCSNNGGVPSCANGTCSIACASSRGNCDGSVVNGCEVSITNNASHCGGCNQPCSTVGGTPSCSGGVCVMACNPGLGDCDANPSNGCETDTTASVQHCGGCGQPCNSFGGTPACVSGACQITCNSGRGDCDANAANGCEVNTASSSTHCGGCNQPCTGGQTCSMGTCM